MPDTLRRYSPEDFDSLPPIEQPANGSTPRPTPTNDTDLELREEVAEGYLLRPETLRRIARVLADDREGIFETDKDSRLCGVWHYWRLDPEQISDEARERGVRGLVSGEIEQQVQCYRAKLNAACEDARTHDIIRRAEEGRPYQSPSEAKGDFGRSQVEAKCVERRRELMVGLDAEVTARLSGPASWEYDGSGVWLDAATGVKARANGEPGTFAPILHLDGSERALEDAGHGYGGGGCTVVIVTDFVVTEEQVAAIETRGRRVAKLGAGYQRALQARLDALTSPPAVLPEV